MVTYFPCYLYLKKILLNLEDEWTQEFLNSLSNDVPSNSVNDQFSSSFHSDRMLWNEQNYM